MKKASRVCFAFMLVTLSFVFLFSSCYCPQSLNTKTTQSKSETTRQVPANILNIDIWVFLSGSYQLLDTDVRDEVIVNVTATLTNPPTVPYEIYFFNIPFSLEYPIPKENLDPPNAIATYGFWGSPPTGFLRIRLPANTNYFSIKLEGHQYGKSVFWRNSAEITPLYVNSSVTGSALYRLLLVPPSSSKILSIYSRAYTNLDYTENNIQGHSCIVVTGRIPFVVMYESETWEVYAFLLMFITILAIFVIPYALRSRKIRLVTSKWIITFRSRTQGRNILRKVLTVILVGAFFWYFYWTIYNEIFIWRKDIVTAMNDSWWNWIPMIIIVPIIITLNVKFRGRREVYEAPQRLLHKSIALLKWLYRRALKLDSSKLLTAYMLCGILMISTSFVAGPDPRLKVYVFASSQGTADSISNFVHAQGGVTVTTFDELGDLRTMANVGVFSAAIIGDFLPPSESQANLKIYPALDNIPNIIILNVTGWRAYEEFSSEIEKRYADKTTVVNDLTSFGAALRRVERRENALGLDVSPNIYLGVSAFVGLCSFILVFLGLAFVASKLIEIGKKPGVRGFPEAVAYTVLYFAFTQLTYIVCSVLLAMPLGLHTSRLGTKVTAVGLLGFGGGSRPRMFAGLAGFLFGAVISLKQGLKLDKAGFISLLMVGFFVIVDPLTSGVLFHEFILLYTVGPYFETAMATQSYVKTFLAEIGAALGGWVSPTYGLSTGTILYCAGIIPFYLSAKLEKSTATVLLFSCAFFAASGGVRVADMNPWSAVASLIPGIVAGFIFAALFALISLAEKAIRTKIGKKGSVT